jgi:hypothetical protein
MDLQPGMDPANPHDNIPLYLRDQPPVVLHTHKGDDWLAVRVTRRLGDEVWLYSPITPTEAVYLLASDTDALDDMVAECTTNRTVTMAAAYEGRITTVGQQYTTGTPLDTAHQWINAQQQH